MICEEVWTSLHRKKIENYSLSSELFYWEGLKKRKKIIKMLDLSSFNVLISMNRTSKREIYFLQFFNDRP